MFAVRWRRSSGPRGAGSIGNTGGDAGAGRDG